MHYWVILIWLPVVTNMPKHVKWLKPDARKVKLNSDGSQSAVPPHVGFGGVIRDEIGD